MSKKKIVIIGGGISGLTAGVYGLKAGYDVSIYEKHSIVGGECTGWDREGYHIDNCIHWMIGTTPGTALNEIWDTVGATGDDVEIISADSMYTSELNDEKITLWKDIKRTEEELIALSPEDEKEIRSLINNIKLAKGVEIPAGKPMELTGMIDKVKLMAKMKDTFKIFKAYQRMDTRDLMDKFKHPLIKCMISDFCTKESLASSFPMAYGNFISGDGGIPRDGSRAMALRMKDRYESLGGKLYEGLSAAKINIEGNKAISLDLSNGESITADYIICACDTEVTFGTLLPTQYMPKLLAKMYKERDAYPVYGMFQVAFAVDNDIDEVGHETIIDCSELQIHPWINNRLTIKSYSYEPKFAPGGKQIVQTLMGLDESAYDYWSELYNDREEYKKEKEKLAEMTLKVLEKRYPNYKGKIRILDIWTPMTYKRYCNAYKGYNQAFMITKKSDKNPYPSAYLDGLDNVILSGQWISPPGGLPGAAITGKFAVQRILHLDKRSVKI